MSATGLRSLLSRVRIPDKIRNGRLRNLFDFYEAVADDYYNVAKDVIQDTKDRRIRAAVILTGLGAGYAAIRTNPDERCFRDQVIEYVHNMGLVDPPIRHPPAYQHVHHLYNVWNERRIRRLNLIFFSILWQADHTPDSGHYASQCVYLKPSFRSFFRDRILDVGIFGRWRLLDYALIDYDVNPEEWRIRDEEKKKQKEMEVNQKAEN